MNDEELLDCPFCGRAAAVEQVAGKYAQLRFGGSGRATWIAGCTYEECWVSFHGHARKVDAVKAWNTRTSISKS